MFVGLSDSYKGLRVAEASLQPFIPDAVPRPNRGLPPSSEGRLREVNAVARQWARLNLDGVMLVGVWARVEIEVDFTFFPKVN